MSANGANGGFFGALKRRMFGAPEANLRESLEDVLEEAQGGRDDFSDEERHMLKNLLGFRDVTLDDVMVPRPRLTGLKLTLTRPSCCRALPNAVIRACRFIARHWTSLWAFCMSKIYCRSWSARRAGQA